MTGLLSRDLKQFEAKVDQLPHRCAVDPIEFVRFWQVEAEFFFPIAGVQGNRPGYFVFFSDVHLLLSSITSCYQSFFEKLGWGNIACATRAAGLGDGVNGVNGVNVQRLGVRIVTLWWHNEHSIA